MMMQINPNTAVSKDQAMTLALEIIATHPDYYGAVPPAFVALKVRDILRFAEDNGIWDPADLAPIVRAMFAPAPECLGTDELAYITSVVTAGHTAPDARAKTIALAAAPPAR